MKKLFAALSAALSALIIFSGCSADFSNKLKVYYSMNAEADLVISDRFGSKKSEKSRAFEKLCDEVDGVLNGLNSSLSLTLSSSYVKKFNEAEAGEKVEINKPCYEVFTIAKNMYELTGGYYNPAVYYSVQAYGFNEAYDKDRPLSDRIPDEGLIEKYRGLSTHFGEVELSESGGKYYAKKPSATIEEGGVTYSLKLDLGGIGKGYAVDKVNELIDEYCFKYGYFNFGASSMVCKTHYENGDYVFGSSNPRPDEEGRVYMTTNAQNVCRSTSGDYEQYFVLDGVRYCHVFDPTTGKPVQTSIMSATVIGGSAAEDDALTTAIMAMGKNLAVQFINEKLSDRKVVFTFDGGESYEIITNIPESELTVTHSKFKLANTVVDGKIVLGGGGVS